MSATRSVEFDVKDIGLASHELSENFQPVQASLTRSVLGN